MTDDEVAIGALFGHLCDDDGASDEPPDVVDGPIARALCGVPWPEQTRNRSPR